MAKQTSSRPSSTGAKQKPTSEAPAKTKQVVAKATPRAETPAPSERSTSAYPAGAAALRAPSHEQIARRAYELYQTRSYAEGNALHDWLRAENDLRVR